MSTEKADAIVIRQADFSESSRVVTFFSREFGKIAALAKGAKRLKGPFDAAIDLLSACRIVFLKKNPGTLSLLTQASLIQKFTPAPGKLNSLYGGYYIADLLNSLTEDEDPSPDLYDLSFQSLQRLANAESDPLRTIVEFEIGLLLSCGLFPNLNECSVCGHEIPTNTKYAHWVSQGSLLCGSCRRDEYNSRSVSAGAVAVLQRWTSADDQLASKIKVTSEQIEECHRLAVSAISHALGRRPGTLRYLTFRDS